VVAAGLAYRDIREIGGKQNSVSIIVSLNSVWSFSDVAR
jgi:hypothetical protein